MASPWSVAMGVMGVMGGIGVMGGCLDSVEWEWWNGGMDFFFLFACLSTNY